MKNTIVLGLIVVVLIGILAVFIFSNLNPGIDGNVTGNSDGSDKVQKVVLSMKNYNYYPNTIYAKVGQPVSISLEDSVKGCYRTVVISTLGLRKTFISSSDTLDFVPIEKGTYEFSCGMRMGVGKIIVE